MNWSKDKGERFEQQLAADEARRWRRAWITSGAFLLLLMVATVGLLRMMRGDPQVLLETSLQELTAANDADEIPRKLDHAAKARDAAESAIGLGADSPSANLLLAAALAIRQDDPNFMIDETYASKASQAKIVPAESSTRELIQAGRAFFFAGDNQRADELLTEAYARNQLRAEVLNPLVQVRYDRGSEGTVLELSEELAKLEPDNCLPWVARSYVFEDRQALEQLVATYQELLNRHCPERDLTRWKLVERLIELGLAAEAAQQWDQLASEFPKVAQAKQSTHAKLLFMQGKLKEAKPMVTALLERNPENIDALLIRGQIALAEDRPQDAVVAFEKTVELDPTHPQAHYQLGQAYAKAGRRDDAKRELDFHAKLSTALVNLHSMERAAAKDTSNTAVRFAIAEKYDELGLTKIGDYWREQALAIDPN